MPGAEARLAEICEENGILLVYLFGSQAGWGAARLRNPELSPPDDPLTDLDAAVLFQEEPPIRGRMRRLGLLQVALSDLFDPVPVDLVLLHETHSVFQAEVIRGRCVYSRDEAFRLAYEESVLRRAADFRPVLERFLAERLEMYR